MAAGVARGRELWKWDEGSVWLASVLSPMKLSVSADGELWWQEHAHKYRDDRALEFFKNKANFLWWIILCIIKVT
jgi:hypothetical protein